jgi:hypothetical protein
MDTTRVKIGDVKRGDMIPGWGGVVVADTFSATEDGVPFWWDTNGQRHTWAGDGYAVVYVATVETHKIGQTLTGVRHILTFDGKPVCPAGRRARNIAVWESGTALASVTCIACRVAYNLVGTTKWYGGAGKPDAVLAAEKSDKEARG